MDWIKRVTTAAVAATLAMSAGLAMAYSVTPTGGDATLVDTSNDQGGGEGALIDAWNATHDPDVVFVYKQDVGGAETGSAAGSYNTVFSNTADDPQDATITFTGGTPLACPTCLLIVKDGATDPSVYLFNLTGWDGEETLFLTGFWPNQCAISHVSLYHAASSSGGPGSGTVPEPASSVLALLGLGLIAAGFRCRAKRG